jgi:4-hydroxy-tetrahydrodipicolinate synthase
MTRGIFLTAMATGALAVGRAGRWAAAASPRRAIPRRAVVPAALTPFDRDLRPDRKEFRRHIEAIAGVPGVAAIMVNGAAGQDGALSRDERRALLAEAVAAVGARTPIVAALRETKEIGSLAPFARDAAAEGASAVAVMPPGDKAKFEWEPARARFAGVLAATDLPVLIYHTAYSTETLTKLAAESPAVFAVKEGSHDPVAFERNLRALRALGREIAVWSTNSSWLLADLAVGADGILSGMGSITADLHVALREAMGRGDLDAARKVADRLFPLTQAFYGRGDAHTRMKYALKRIGRLRSDAVRPPLRPLEDGEKAAIDAALRRSGLLA